MNAVRRGIGRAGSIGALALLLTGCAARAPELVRPHPSTLPAGSPLRSTTLGEGDAWLRHHLIQGEHQRALSVLAHPKVAPSDALLQALQSGMVLHQGADHQQSNQWFAWAEAEADRRYTRSVVRAAATMVVNDRMLAYTPSRAELLMIPYYRILNYLALEDRDGALVEARKASALLLRIVSATGKGCGEAGMLHYLSGLVFASAGETNDALVSLRSAEQAFRGCAGPASGGPPAGLVRDLHGLALRVGFDEVADSVAYRYSLAPDAVGTLAPQPNAEGDLVVFLENGFVAHRAPRELNLPVLASEIAELSSDDASGILKAAATIVARLSENVAEQAYWGQAWDDQPGVQLAHALDGGHILRFSWSVPRRETTRPASLRLLVNDSVVEVTPVGDLSSAMEREMEENRTEVFTRSVARAVGKYLIARELEKKAERKGGEIAGFIAGRVANMAGNELERADTRSWSLLPDQVSMARLRLPPGSYQLTVETLSQSGEVLTRQAIPEVTVEPDRLVAIRQRIWEEGR